MRIIYVAVIIGAIACNPVKVEREKEEVAAVGQCDPESILELLGRAIEGGDPKLSEPTVITARELAVLMGGEETPDEAASDEAPAAVVEQMILEWHTSLRGAKFVRHRVGIKREKAPLPNISRSADVIEDSSLVFRGGQGETTVRVDRMIRVDACWRLEDVSYPEVQNVDDRTSSVKRE